MYRNRNKLVYEADLDDRQFERKLAAVESGRLAVLAAFYHDHGAPVFSAMVFAPRRMPDETVRTLFAQGGDKSPEDFDVVPFLTDDARIYRDEIRLAIQTYEGGMELEQSIDDWLLRLYHEATAAHQQ